jgi:(2Fe-2S) ferredoxin
MIDKATTYRAYICFGPNCSPKGSAALLAALERELASAGLEERVSVLPTGCQAHCESGPTMVIYPGPTYYQQVDAARLERIVREHFAAGSPVAEYFWTGTRRRILPDGRKVLVGKPVAESPLSTTERAGERPTRPRSKPQRDVDDFKW